LPQLLQKKEQPKLV